MAGLQSTGSASTSQEALWAGAVRELHAVARRQSKLSRTLRRLCVALAPEADAHGPDGGQATQARTRVPSGLPDADAAHCVASLRQAETRLTLLCGLLRQAPEDGAGLDAGEVESMLKPVLERVADARRLASRLLRA